MITLDKLAKKILNFAIDIAGTTDTFFSINPEWDSEATIPFQTLVDAAQVPPSVVLAAVKYLSENGFIEYRRLHAKHRDINLAFRLTHTGLHYKEFRHLATRERWTERIIGFVSGVLVSIVGGLILATLVQ